MNDESGIVNYEFCIPNSGLRILNYDFEFGIANSELRILNPELRIRNNE